MIVYSVHELTDWFSRVVCVWIHCCGGGYGVTGFSLLRESQPFELSPSRLPHLRGYVAQLAFVC